MIASVYIKDGNICFYNEKDGFSNYGGLVYELGKPLLNFVCYETEMFIDAFSAIAEVYDNEYAHEIVKHPDFIVTLRESMSEFQYHEQYIYFYSQMLAEFVFAFIESPRGAIEQLERKIPGAEKKLSWTFDFEWPKSNLSHLEVHYADKERRLFRAAKDVVALMLENLKSAQEATIFEIEVLLKIRETATPESSSMEYLYALEYLHSKNSGHFHFLEKPFRTFYGVTKPPEIVELYEIDTIKDLLRFEFIKMIEHDIFIKKCKNCERFFIPQRRVDAEYCNRIYGDTQRRCNEIGAMLRYEKKVAENPVWEAYKKAYRRFNSRTRAKKMTQSEFMAWSDEAAKKRDECLAETLPFDEFVAWLEQGRVRKPRGGSKNPE